MDFLEHRKELVRRLLVMARGDRMPDLAETVRTETAAAYLDPDRFEVEIEHMFLKYPNFVAFSGELPNPGDYRTFRLGGVPLVIVRGRDNVVRAFRNACSHRGRAIVDDDKGCGIRRLTCPYHGWSYDDKGSLVGVPGRAGFPDLDFAQHGLTPVQVEEWNGLIFALVDGSQQLDVVEHLGPMAEFLEYYAMGDWEVDGPYVCDVKANWKLVVDTFLESYHFPWLHRNTLLPVVIGASLAVDPLGQHVLETFPVSTLADLTDDESTWGEAAGGAHLSPIYVLCPNVVIALSDVSAQVFVTVPGDNVGESRCLHYKIFSPRIPAEERATVGGFYDFAFYEAVIKEDLKTTESIQSSLRAGNRETVMFGRSELPLQHMHIVYDEILAKAAASS